MARLQPFYLLRHEDVNGVSGTGIVAIGAIYPSGTCIIEWLTFTSSINHYRSFEQVKEVHGHEGRTEIVMGNPPGQKGRKKKV